MSRLRTLSLLVGLLATSLAPAGPALAEGPGHHEPGRGNARLTRPESRTEHEDAKREQHELRARAIHGEIERIAGTIWTVDRAGRAGVVPVDVAGAEVHWPDKPNATIGDFRVGDTVNVKLARPDRERGRPDRNEVRPDHERGRPDRDEVLRARAVHFVPSHRRDRERDREGDRFRGTVAAVSATSLTVTSTDLGSRTFTLSDQTRVRLGSMRGTVADIRVGDQVSVSSKDGETLAQIVLIRAELARFRGAVTAVSATSLTVNSTELGSRTFTLTSRTVVRDDDGSATIADIRVGERVVVTTREGDPLALLVVVRD